MKRIQRNYKYYLRQVEGLMGAGYEARYGIGGKAAAWGNLKGGADQFTLPLNVMDMEKIGVLRGRNKK